MRFRVLWVGLLACVVLSVSAVSGFGRRRDLADYKDNLAPYVVSPEHAIDKMLQMANLKSGETLYDLGCGDGRILIAAASKYKVKAVGIEISDHLAKTAVERVKKAGLENQVKVMHGRLHAYGFECADVVTLYLATTANESSAS